jgi:hypothetical protein
MKQLNGTSILLALLALSSSALADRGGISSNGPTGQELLDCSGSFRLSKDNLTELRIRVFPVMGQGLAAKLSFSEDAQLKPDLKKVERIENDPRGLLYQGSKIDILIPHTQLPKKKRQAIVTIPEFGPDSAILDCKKK